MKRIFLCCFKIALLLLLYTWMISAQTAITVIRDATTATNGTIPSPPAITVPSQPVPQPSPPTDNTNGNANTINGNTNNGNGNGNGNGKGNGHNNGNANTGTVVVEPVTTTPVIVVPSEKKPTTPQLTQLAQPVDVVTPTSNVAVANRSAEIPAHYVAVNSSNASIPTMTANVTSSQSTNKSVPSKPSPSQPKRKDGSQSNSKSETDASSGTDNDPATTPDETIKTSEPGKNKSSLPIVLAVVIPTGIILALIFVSKKKRKNPIEKDFERQSTSYMAPSSIVSAVPSTMSMTSPPGTNFPLQKSCSNIDKKSNPQGDSYSARTQSEIAL